MLCCIAKWFRYTYIFFFNILFHCGLSQDIEYSFLCSAVGPCLFILYVTVYICCPRHPIPSLPHPPHFLGNHKSVPSAGTPFEASWLLLVGAHPQSLEAKSPSVVATAQNIPPPRHQLLRDGTGRWVSRVPHLCSGTRAGPDDKTQWDMKWKCRVCN